jgi:hypothetical protein
MCDFRDIKQIIIIETEEVIDIDEEKPWRWDDGVAPKGFYYFIASGSWHAYSTGEKWLHEDFPDKPGDYIVTKVYERPLSTVFQILQVKDIDIVIE